MKRTKNDSNGSCEKGKVVRLPGGTEQCAGYAARPAKATDQEIAASAPVMCCETGPTGLISGRSCCESTIVHPHHLNIVWLDGS